MIQKQWLLLVSMVFLPIAVMSAGQQSALFVHMRATSGKEMDRELLKAARHGEENEVLSCLKAGADIGATDTVWGKTSLVFAAQQGHYGVVHLLLSKSSEQLKQESPTVKDKTAALIEAVLYCRENTAHNAIIPLLMQEGASAVLEKERLAHAFIRTGNREACTFFMKDPSINKIMQYDTKFRAYLARYVAYYDRSALFGLPDEHTHRPATRSLDAALREARLCNMTEKGACIIVRPVLPVGNSRCDHDQTRPSVSPASKRPKTDSEIRRELFSEMPVSPQCAPVGPVENNGVPIERFQVTTITDGCLGALNQKSVDRICEDALRRLKEARTHEELTKVLDEIAPCDGVVGGESGDEEAQ